MILLYSSRLKHDLVSTFNQEQRSKVTCEKTLDFSYLFCCISKPSLNLFLVSSLHWFSAVWSSIFSHEHESESRIQKPSDLLTIWRILALRTTICLHEGIIPVFTSFSVSVLLFFSSHTNPNLCVIFVAVCVSHVTRIWSATKRRSGQR